MGTRHLQKVINKEGEVKLSQYGQWDGYPDGQGLGILKYLKKGNLDKYLEEVNKLKEATEDDLEKIDVECGEDWKRKYPYLSRDCGSDIHQMIEDGKVKLVNLESEEEANKWCEGFYTVDFQSGKFISEYHGAYSEFNLDDLPNEEDYLKSMNESD